MAGAELREEMSHSTTITNTTPQTRRKNTTPPPPPDDPPLELYDPEDDVDEWYVPPLELELLVLEKLLPELDDDDDPLRKLPLELDPLRDPPLDDVELPPRNELPPPGRAIA